MTAGADGRMDSWSAGSTDESGLEIHRGEEGGEGSSSACESTPGPTLPGIVAANIALLICKHSTFNTLLLSSSCTKDHCGL